jgi:hypothetical protein
MNRRLYSDDKQTKFQRHQLPWSSPNQLAVSRCFSLIDLVRQVTIVITYAPQQTATRRTRATSLAASQTLERTQPPAKWKREIGGLLGAAEHRSAIGSELGGGKLRLRMTRLHNPSFADVRLLPVRFQLARHPALASICLVSLSLRGRRC